MKEVRVRTAPSPTGLAHIGNIYTALFNYAYAKKNKGKFVLRIENTDTERFVVGAEKVVIDSLNWLGLKYDEGPDVGGKYGPYRQSERIDLYKKYAKQLQDQDLAYKKEGAVWFKIPQGKTSWNDLVRGKIEFDNSQIKDFVILRSNGFPAYNFAVVIDDYSMKMSTVIRAEEHISNTPRQIMLYKALKAEVPEFAHLPLLRNPDQSKISKRRNPVAVSWYKENGYLPEALVNFLCLLGWSHPKGKEIFFIDEFIKNFSFKRVSTSAPIFDFKKLDWLNGHYIREKKDEELIKLLKPFTPKGMKNDLIKQTIPLFKERLINLSDYKSLVDFFVEEPKVDKKLLLKKSGKDGKLIKEQFKKAVERLEKVKDWETKTLEDLFRKIVQDNDYHLGKFFMATRIAITGKFATPPLFETMEVLGKEKTIKRLKKI